MQYYLDFWRKYVDFKGRTSRKAFWMTVLFHVVVYAVLYAIDYGIMMAANDFPYMALSSLYGLAAFIPGLAMIVRRFHDQDRSGWFILLGLIPFFGALVLFIFYLLPGTAGKNRFGEPEKMEKKVA